MLPKLPEVASNGDAYGRINLVEDTVRVKTDLYHVPRSVAVNLHEAVAGSACLETVDDILLVVITKIGNGGGTAQCRVAKTVRKLGDTAP